jgi:hypothetical protein
MPEHLKKFSAAVLEDFKKALALKPAADLIEKTKAAESAGTFKVIISTSDEDRQGDTVDQTKWNLKNFENNPVVLWAHDYYSLPIGVATKIGVEDGKLVAEGKFAPADLNPFAAQVAALYEAGFIKTTSVGYMQHESGELELLEFSFVPVPANPYALSMREMKQLKLNVPELVMKGIQFEAKAEAAGDPCEMPGGGAGVLAEDKDNPGQLVCVPVEAKAADDEKKDEPTDEKKPKTEVATINEDGKAFIAEAISLGIEKSQAEALLATKSGRAISSANKEKIKAIIKSVEDGHAAHGVASNTVIAALKDLMGPDEGNEGEEKPEKTASPKPKVEVRDIRQVNDGFEDIMTARRVLRKVDDVVGKALSDLNTKFRENRPDRR